MRNPLINLFDAYQASQGTVNLQIHSTSVTNTDSDSLYTNVLAERSSGYTFDIGLITSTGEVVAYLTKRNEWMVANCWYYGFILRYPDDKTSITGVDYMPHHFRYVGLPHSLIMYENNYCLEEYLDYLKSYTIDQPLTYTTDDASYEIYYYAANSNGETEVKIPKKDSSRYKKVLAKSAEKLLQMLQHRTTMQMQQLVTLQQVTTAKRLQPKLLLTTKNKK
jgi:D-alanyl-D-alanine carboxypeptidase